MTHCRRLLAAWATIVLLAPAHALAQAPREKRAESSSDVTAEARSHFRKGVEYYGDGDYSAALLEFERAYELSPSYRLLYNMGQVAFEQRDYVAAERHFTAYLEQGGQDVAADRREAVERDLERLKERIGFVELRVEQSGAELFVDGKSVGSSPLDEPVRMSAGRRSVRAEHPDYAPVDRVIEVVGGETLGVDLDLGPLPAKERPPPVADRKEEAPKPLYLSAPFLTGVAAGALALGGGVMAYAASRDSAAYEDALGRTTSRTELDSLEDGARNKALVADVLFGGALVAGTVAVILLLTDGDEPEHAKIGSIGSVGTVGIGF